MPNQRRSSEQKGYQHDFRHIGYLMPLYLLPLLFYGTHGSRSLYCVILAMSWWILGPLPKVANAFLLLCCPAILQVADPERLAASFFSAEVLEATLLLLLSTADREVRSRLAPWLALRSQAEGMRLRYLFPAVCLGTFALATRVSAALITVVLFAIVDHALRSLEEAHLDTHVFGEPVPLIADDAERLGMLLHHAAPSPRSPAGPPTPHLMADHPLNKYSPPRLLERPTSAKAARPATSTGYSGGKMPLGTMPGPQASRDKARVPLTATDLASREPSYVPCEESVKDGTLAPQVSSQISGASSVLAEPRRREPPLSIEASSRSRQDHPGAVIGRARDIDGGSKVPTGRTISCRGTSTAANTLDSFRKSSASRLRSFSSRQPTQTLHHGSVGSRPRLRHGRPHNGSRAQAQKVRGDPHCFPRGTGHDGRGGERDRLPHTAVPPGNGAGRDKTQPY
ncbi:uncharacterized protein LOC142574038 [Dermacentor variabilis]|uniref:uncharacterized protein LOC142574038 n=1 Tax=Dermacentor variabilis TaxID=34621 RepID=UPI003F5BECE1